MSSDVVLSAALRNNLLSLQSTQSKIDSTQLKLATGKKVNSALDNPQSFFAAQTLNNRASDLSRLLDGIGQAISTIKAADQGIASLTKMIEQADSLATTALEATSSASDGASVVGDVDVSDYEFTDAVDFNINFTNAEGEYLENLTLGGAAAGNDQGTADQIQIAIASGDSIDDLVNEINSIEDGDGNKIMSASITDSGKLQINTLNGTNAKIQVDTSAGTNSLAATQTAIGELGMSSIFADIDPTGTADGMAVNIEANASITSQALYDATDSDSVAKRSTLLVNLERDANGDGTIDDDAFGITDVDDDGTFSVNIGINGGPAATVTVTKTTTIQGLVDGINGNASINSRIEASFDETTGKITIAAKDGSVESVSLSASASDDVAANGATSTVAWNMGFGTTTNVTATALDNGSDSPAQTNVEIIRFGSGGGDIAQAQSDFNKVREQIDALVADSGYRGVNLLNGDNLVTTFNEDRTNKLTTEGDDFTSTGLGIDEAAFATRAGIEDSISQVRAALAKVREFGGSISNDLAIIQTREDFTKNTINNLQEGSDKLTIADQNEEGAKLLALQTRQQLGVVSLSLASQSQQAVLRLF